jgi:hypothetical protein
MIAMHGATGGFGGADIRVSSLVISGAENHVTFAVVAKWLASLVWSSLVKSSLVNE